MRIECIKIEQPIGEFYLCSLSSNLLKKVTYSRVASFSEGEIAGNQRSLKDERINEIKNYLSTSNAAMPNSIILSANYYDTDELEVDGGKRWEVVEENGRMYIDVPDENLKICSIIDGQHRINGFVGSQVVMNLPCSVFIDLPPSLQAFVFSTINFNQKKVDKSLAYQLFGYQLDESNSMSWSPDILAVKLSRSFNSSGPLAGRIQLIKKSGGGLADWSISSAAFIEGVVSLISSNPKADKYIVNRKKAIGYGSRKDLKPNKNLPLRDYYIEGNDRAIMDIIQKFFEGLSATLWQGRGADDIVFRTVGFSAQFSFLIEVLLEGSLVLNKDLSFVEFLDPLRDVSFDHEYFSARTATKRRLLSVFKLKLQMMPLADTDPVLVSAAKLSIV